jgi:hypothetical protein
VGTPVRGLVANGDDILVLGDPGDAVLRVDIGSMEVVARGTHVLDVATMNGQVWAVVESGHLVRLDPDLLQPIAADRLEAAGTDSLVTGGGSVWTTGLDGVGDAELLQVVPAE